MLGEPECAKPRKLLAEQCSVLVSENEMEMGRDSSERESVLLYARGQAVEVCEGP